MTRDELPLVTIAIPTFNRAGRLRKSLQSACDQDYPRLEIIVSDNASTDSTADVCATFALRDPRVSCHRHVVNVGAANNFSHVFSLANSEMFMWLADDDWIDPRHVRRCVDALLADPDAVLAGPSAIYYDNGHPTAGGQTINCVGRSGVQRVFEYYRQVEDNAIFYGVMRRSAAARISLRNCLGGDWLFMAAMAYQGKVVSPNGFSLHRDMGGTSASLAKMAKGLGVPSWQTRLPLTFFIAAFACGEIARKDPVYLDLPAPVRLLFAASVAGWIVLIKPVQEFRRRQLARRRQYS